MITRSHFRFIMLTIVACFALQVSADNVDAASAKKIASSFLTQKVQTGMLKAPAIQNLRLIETRQSAVLATAADFYVFSGTASYVIVSGDDQVPAVLAYGDESITDMDNIAPAMKFMLDNYAMQMEALISGQAKPVMKASTTYTAVAPLITALWDQTAPYYNHTPTVNGKHCYTGCPATSLSMCFNKWKYPKTYPAVAAIAANSTYGYAAAPALSAKDADWDNMLDDYSGSYTTAQAEAVSWLMRYVGQAENMGYSTSGSGAMGEDIVDACHKFGYSNAELLTLTTLTSSGYGYSQSSQKYTDAQWNEFLMTELKNGRPMVYCAYDLSNKYQPSGHAFNVDGCDASGKYHVNWGWSGVGNGYFTLHNFVASTSATGQSGSSYTFNKGEQLVRYIYPVENATVPTITTSATSLSMTTTVGTAVSKTFTVKGSDLTGDITLKLNDSNGAFSISTTSISKASAASGVTVTVKYNPTAAGTHTATVQLSSADASTVTIGLSGQASNPSLVVYTPVMKDATNITNTSFRAEWTDQTATANVKSYTLSVETKGTQPATTELANIDLSGVTQVTNSNGYLSDISSKITSYMGAGWSASTYVYANTGMLITKGNIVSPSYNLTGYGKVTVKVKASSYYSSYYGNATLKVSTSKGSATQALSSTSTEYTFVLDCADADKITIGSSSNYIALSSVRIIAGNTQSLSLKAAAENGDATQRTITGITNKYYTVQNLTEGGTFTFKVKAIYTDGTESEWSNVKEVTLTKETTPEIVKADPVMNDATDITATSFKANWTHNVATSAVKNYTLYVKKVGTNDTGDDEPEQQAKLLASIDGSNYTGNYTSITLKSPWAGSNVKGGNSAFYIKNSTSSWWWSSSTTKGYITYTVPTGYTNATFTVKITTANNSYGAGNITVKSAKTSEATHKFAKGESYTWSVKVSAGDKITINSSDASYSPDMTLIEIYDGTVSLNTAFTATESGDGTQKVISGIAAGTTEYTVTGLDRNGIYSYYLVATYSDDDTVESNAKEVTLTQGFGMSDETAINAATGSLEPAETFYINLNGQQSLEPWKGVNIVVKRFSDGTSKTTKQIFR